MNLVKVEYYNPYYINGNEVKRIVFFDKTGVIVEHQRGWLGASNNDGNNVLEELDFVNRRKENFSRVECFFISDVIYVHTDFLPRFEFYGEQLAVRSDSDLHYGNFFGFECAETRKAGDVEFRKFMSAYYTRSEKTPYGAKLEEISEKLKSHGLDISSYQISKLCSVTEDLVALGGLK